MPPCYVCCVCLTCRMEWAMRCNLRLSRRTGCCGTVTPPRSHSVNLNNSLLLRRRVTSRDYGVTVARVCRQRIRPGCAAHMDLLKFSSLDDRFYVMICPKEMYIPLCFLASVLCHLCWKRWSRIRQRWAVLSSFDVISDSVRLHAKAASI